MKKGDEVMMVNRSQVKNDRTREEGRGREVHFFEGVGGCHRKVTKTEDQRC